MLASDLGSMMMLPRLRAKPSCRVLATRIWSSDTYQMTCPHCFKRKKALPAESETAASPAHRAQMCLGCLDGCIAFEAAQCDRGFARGAVGSRRPG